MSRNRYINLIHKEELVQIEQQIEETAALAKSLGRKNTESPEAQDAGDSKEQRRFRLEQKRRHKL